jgi:hypothetical protein
MDAVQAPIVKISVDDNAKVHRWGDGCDHPVPAVSRTTLRLIVLIAINKRQCLRRRIT